MTMENDDGDSSQEGSSKEQFDTGAETQEKDIRFKFRNYTPQTHLFDGMFTTEKAQPGSITHLIQDKLDLVPKDESGYRIDPKLLEPKKVDWDLKRRIERRMEVLERETCKSIARHIKERKRKR